MSLLPPHRRTRKVIIILLAIALLGLSITACTPPSGLASATVVVPKADPEPAETPELGLTPEAVASAVPEIQATPDAGKAGLVVYSGRNENLIAPLIEDFEKETGIDVQVRYGETAEMAATILEEGQNSPADVFFGQDAGALGVLSANGILAALPEDVLAQVDAHFRSAHADWVGTSGRARVVVYNTNLVQESDLPADIWGFTDAKWQGKLGWAPTNGSFQAFITALRKLEGQDKARQWLEAMIANGIQVYPSNAPIVEAVGKGEIVAGFVNHYYLFRYLAEQGDGFPARNHFLAGGDAGSMINVAGVGILKTAKHTDAALSLVRFLLSDEAQTYFAEQTEEYPLVATIPADPRLPALADIAAPNLDLNNLQDLQGTLELLQDVGALE